ncbi:MAG: flippase-like domain-containing protein [Prolixibacteraceae bacterium]|nr:flippase-like domain-containing protein [Prolixibacteraceae bacterium]
MKKYFKYVIYISLIFLIIALYRADYLIMPEIYSWYWIILSLVTLFAGFIMESITWNKTLSVMGYAHSLKKAVISIGLSIFGKYIPGKIWLIAGRSAYIAKETEQPGKQIITVSMITQLISIWMGLLFGVAGLLFVRGLFAVSIVAIIFWVLISLFLFLRYPHQLFLKVLKLVLKKDINLPRIHFGQIINVLPWYFIRWIFFTLSFYFLILGLTQEGVSIYVGLGYPLAGTLGLIAVFAPGGIGIREGILGVYLKLSGFDVEIATTIAITSRLWYLFGEIFIFLLALFLQYASHSKRLKRTNQ